MNYLSSVLGVWRPVEKSGVASLEQLFRGDLKDPHYSFELDLSLCIWPPRSSVQRISVPLRIVPPDEKGRG